MKGLVFKELLEMAEKMVGEEMVELILEKCDLPSGGAYTSVGNYDPSEIFSIVASLSTCTGDSVSNITRRFGVHLISVFAKDHGKLFDRKNTFTFLSSLDDLIHIEVKKLYPQAELPNFEVIEITENEMTLRYFSVGPFADLAQGLIEGAIYFFNEPIELENIDTSNGKNTSRTFILRKR